VDREDARSRGESVEGTSMTMVVYETLQSPCLMKTTTRLTIQYVSSPSTQQAEGLGWHIQVSNPYQEY
jgi:hypothetical protein